MNWVLGIRILQVLWVKKVNESQIYDLIITMLFQEHPSLGVIKIYVHR